MDAGIFIPLSFIRTPFAPSERAVMVLLASLLPDGGPRVIEARWLARDTGLSEGGVHRAINVLEGKGYLRVVRRPAEGNTYTLGDAWLGSKAGATR